MAGKEQLERQLEDDGIKLLNPPFSIDQLLSILVRVEVLLSRAKQSSYGSIDAALSPLRKALVSDDLLRHSDTDVKVSVAFCISQIMRITAPNYPYDEELMKEIFHLIVDVFQKLSHTSSNCYPKVVSLLVTIAKTDAIVLLLDLNCQALIIEMFQLFLKTIGSNDLDVVFTAMVAIMSVALLESDEIPLGLLIPLLASVRKDNKTVSPTSRMLGKEVIQNTAVKIEPYLLEAVCGLGVSVDNYDQVVGSICRNATHNFKPFHADGSEEYLIKDEGPTTQSVDEENIRFNITSRSTGNEETDIKGQSADFLSGYSSKMEEKQLATFSKTLLDEYANVQICQKHTLENQEIHNPSSVDAFRANNEEGCLWSDIVSVQGYEVKTSSAPILAAIFTKYGDIAANCHHKSLSMRASLLEIACAVVRRLQSTEIPLTLYEIKVIQNEVKSLEAAKLAISWLSQPLAKISEVEKIAQMHSMLVSVKADSIMVIKAATKELEEALTDLAALQKRMGEAEKRIDAMKLVVQKIDDTINETEAECRLWQRRMKEIL